MVEDSPRTILYLSPLPPPRGGIATWTETLVRRGLLPPYRPLVVDTSVGETRKIFQRGGVIHEMRRSWRILWTFARRARAPRPAMAHLNVDPLSIGLLRDLLCGAMAKALGIPVVVHYRGLVSELGEGDRWFQRWVVRRAARLADLNLALNEPSAAFLRRQAGRRPVRRLPNFYDDEKIPDLPLPRREPSQRARVLFVGGLTRAKGVAEIIELARSRPEIDFRLAGAPHSDTEACLREVPGNVRLLGEIGHEAVLREMSSSHVLLLPTRREGFPNVVCEAMAVGLPVIASPVGAIPEMVEDGRGGWIAEPRLEPIGRALDALLADEDRRLAMGRFNREKCRRLYAYPSVVRDLCHAYSAVLDAETGRGLPQLGDRAAERSERQNAAASQKSER